jgi:hypothetical protein
MKKSIKTIIENIQDIRFIEQSSIQNLADELVEDSLKILVTQRDDIDAITVQYTFENIIKKNNFDEFVNEMFQNINYFSPIILDGLKLFHRSLVENAEQLIHFNNTRIIRDEGRGSVTFLFEKNNDSFIFKELIMTSLLFCKFKDDTHCFYNIKYTYGNPENFAIAYSKNNYLKIVEKFSNNIFIYLVDSKVREVLTDVYINYTPADIKNIKTLHQMISI